MADTGKPEVAGSDLCFSTSSSHDLALYAISMSTEVGVDVEAVRPRTDLERLAARFFTAAERCSRSRPCQPASGKRRAFRPGCVRRHTARQPGADSTFPAYGGRLDASGEPALVADWSVHEVDLGPGFAAAVAGRGPLVVDQPCPAVAIDRGP